ncbi:MAG: NAD-dependent epimerase/dehydratase family protein, partial [Gemmatimonadales bacterium]
MESVQKRYAFRGTFLEADLARPGAFAQLVGDLHPHLTINLVGYGVDREERDAGLARRLNAELPVEIAGEIARRPPETDWAGQRLIHVGSAFEYGSAEGSVHEETSCAPASVYGQTKLAGTRGVAQIRRETGLAAVTLRIATVYGPGEHPHRLLPSLIRASHTGETLSLTAGGQERDFTFVGDVAEGILRTAAVARVPWDTINLATGELTTVRAFATCAIERLGLGPGKVAFGALPYREDEVWQGRIEVGRMKQVLEWVPATGIAEGVRRTIEFETRCAETMHE